MPSFVNTVDNVRIEKDLLFLRFGSVGPGRNGEAEFSPCSDIVMRLDDAGELFQFIIQKISEGKREESTFLKNDHADEEIKSDVSKAHRKLLTSI